MAQQEQIWPYTPRQVVAELEREVQVREDVYPAWIEKGRISPAIAEQRIGLLKFAANLIREHVPLD